MLRKFFKRLLIGAAALAAAVLAVKVAKKVLAPKKAAEEALSEHAAVENELRNYQGIVAQNGKVTSRNDLQQFAEDYFRQFPTQAWDAVMSGDFIHDEGMQVYLLRRMDGWSHEEAIATSKPKPRFRFLTLETLQHIDDFHMMFPFSSPGLEFRGLFDDDILVPGFHSKSVPQLRSVTLKMNTAGTREFYARYAYLGKDVAQAHLEPRQRPKTTIEEDHALQARARLFELDEPLDIVKLKDDMFARNVDEDAFLQRLERATKRAAQSRTTELWRAFPDGWAFDVGLNLEYMRIYTEGYTDEARARFKLYLAALMILRNRAWGVPGSDMPLYIVPALWRYCVAELRWMIWTEESLQEENEDPEIEPYTKEDIAEFFERFLNLIALPHPARGDIIRHTPMKLVKHVVLDMEPIN